jgi:selT/selW/selH-like putative selenoprotein
VASLIESRTDLKVRGGDYPIEPTKAQIASIIQYIQLGLVGGIMLVSDTLLPAIVRENKFALAIGVWFIGSMVISGIRNTGAFEIYIGQKLVWSTLTQGRMPTLNDLVNVLGVDLVQR